MPISLLICCMYHLPIPLVFTLINIQKDSKFIKKMTYIINVPKELINHQYTYRPHLSPQYTHLSPQYIRTVLHCSSQSNSLLFSYATTFIYHHQPSINIAGRRLADHDEEGFYLYSKGFYLSSKGKCIRPGRIIRNAIIICQL